MYLDSEFEGELPLTNAHRSGSQAGTRIRAVQDIENHEAHILPGVPHCDCQMGGIGGLWLHRKCSGILQMINAAVFMRLEITIL